MPMALDMAFLGVPGQGDGNLEFNNTVCDTAYALAQKALILLFTDINNQYSLGFGTNLPTDLAGANNYDAGQLKGLFDIAAQRVMDNIQQNTPVEAPDEARLNRIECLVPEELRNGDTAEVTVTVFPVAGPATVVKAPVKLS
jgi:hypothetical protein